VTQVDVAGLSSTSVTDGMGNVISTSYPDDTTMVLRRFWPAALGITTAGFAYATVHFDRCGANTTTYIDGAGRGVRSVHYNSNFSAQDLSILINTVIVDTVYGTGGLPVAVSDPFFAAGDPGMLPYPATSASAKEGIVRWSTFGYDAAWREVSMTHPDNSSQTTVYDGFTTMRTDENGHASTVIADCNSRKLRSVDAINGTVSFAYTPWNTVQSLVGESCVMLPGRVYSCFLGL
jgi:YD repeat-containing protein